MDSEGQDHPLMKRVVKVTFDEDVCLRHRCCSVAPRVFGELSDEHPIIPENVAEYLDADRDKIIEAVMSCPVAAISLQFEDGKVLGDEDYDPEKSVDKWVQY